MTKLMLSCDTVIQLQFKCSIVIQIMFRCDIVNQLRFKCGIKIQFKTAGQIDSWTDTQTAGQIHRHRQIHRQLDR